MDRIISIGQQLTEEQKKEYYKNKYEEARIEAIKVENYKFPYEILKEEEFKEWQNSEWSKRFNYGFVIIRDKSANYSKAAKLYPIPRFFYDEVGRINFNECEWEKNHPGLSIEIFCDLYTISSEQL
jgi:hypothetical protein